MGCSMGMFFPAATNTDICIRCRHNKRSAAGAPKTMTTAVESSYFQPRRKRYLVAVMRVKLTGVRANLIGHSPKFIGG